MVAYRGEMLVRERRVRARWTVILLLWLRLGNSRTVKMNLKGWLIFLGGVRGIFYLENQLKLRF
jgi:hypothetical protein